MTDDPFKEASKYNTAVRNVQKWFARRVHELEADRENKLRAIRAALSPAAARIVVAAEQEEPAGTCEARSLQNPGVVVKHDGTGAYTVEHDPNPAPAWLNEEPPPLPAGAMLEVSDKPRKRA